jgi:hypothetical protein
MYPLIGEGDNSHPAGSTIPIAHQFTEIFLHIGDADRKRMLSLVGVTVLDRQLFREK